MTEYDNATPPDGGIRRASDVRGAAGMNLEDLRAVQADERGTDGLQPLRESFYRDVAAYLDDLRAQRDRAAERAADPFDSEEVRQLTDEIETVEEVVEAIYDRRVGKVVKRASLAAAGMPTDDTGLTDEEAELFTDLVERIETNRQAVLDVVGPTDRSPAAEADSASTPGEPPESPSSRAGDPAPTAGPDEAGAGSDEDDPGESAEGSTDGTSNHSAGDAAPTGPTTAADAGTEAAPAGSGEPDAVDRVTVRITRDVGEIFGVDERTYELASEDVVTLPVTNAEPLLERDAARRVD